LLEEIKKTNQPQVSLEGMSRSLKAVEARLRAQHGGNRRIDFEVELRDGKPVLKPVVR
jgi:EAL domain-containing protein (putative c-di-GMP-specific phosphodiesterase class I)